MMEIDADVVVIGAGAMGSAAAATLAAAERHVIVLERHELGHARGGSHGRTRLFRAAVDDEQQLLRVQRARTLWRELEGVAGVQLIETTGSIDHGVDDRTVDTFRELFTRHGIAHEVLAPEEAAQRWPGLRFASPVLYQPGGGRILAERAVSALQDVAAARGAVLRPNTAAVQLRVVRNGSGRGPLVEVDVADETLRARQAVITAGPWTPRLLADVVELPAMRITQEQPRFFAPTDPDASWPSFVHWRDGAPPYGSAEAYGLLEPGSGVKVGLHGTGAVVDPDERDFRPAAEPDAALLRYVRDWFPGLDPDRSTPISCLYDLTARDTFVIDRAGPVTVAAGFCGQGFKFVPLVGRYVADLVTGQDPVPATFALRAHRELTKGA